MRLGSLAWCLVPAHPDSPGKWAVKRVCVCVCVCIELVLVTSDIAKFLVVACVVEHEIRQFGLVSMSSLCANITCHNCHVFCFVVAVFSFVCFKPSCPTCQFCYLF